MKKTSLLMILAAGLWACGAHDHDHGDGNDADSTKTEESHEGHDHEGHDHDGHDHADHDHGDEEATAGVEIKEGQKVFWIAPTNGETLKSPFGIKMGVEGMEVEEAGYVNEDKGHHHVLINKDPIESGTLLQQGDPTIIHYGKGQTQAEIELEPGKYMLTLQFANGAHESYGPKMAETIEITVE